MKRILAVVTMAAAMVVGSATQSLAISISFAPANQTVGVGTDPVTVDLVIAGLAPGTGLGAFDLDVTLSNPAIVGFNGYTLTSYLGLIGTEADDFSIGFDGADTINLQLLSYMDPADLVALQGPTGGTFTLATLSFFAASIGTTFLDVTRQVLSNEDGTVTLLVDDFFQGQINVVAANPVPEPATLVTLGVGVLALARRRRAMKSRRS